MSKYVWFVIGFLLLAAVALATQQRYNYMPFPMPFPGIFDAVYLAIDASVLAFLAVSWLLYRHYRKPVWLVLTTIFAYTLVLAVALTVLLWPFRGY
jgi:uncharacterized membrane protein